MPGKAKRKYQGETIRLAKSLKRPLDLIMFTLKPGYTEKDILEAFKKYYPSEWDAICERYTVYSAKDSFLRNIGKKKRYYPKRPEEFFCSLPKVEYLLTKAYRTKHAGRYDEDARQKYCLEFEAKRTKRIQKQLVNITQNTREQQSVDPGFLDALIYAYHRRGNSTNDKLEIFKEIQKYDCEKSWIFFWKLNDSERNDEIRKRAFQHLQKSGHYVKLRNKFKGKKKSYMTETSSFDGTPEALANKLKNSRSVQNVKHYDLFISHSYQDRGKVYDVVGKANEFGLNCYVDWTADNDYLKRGLVSEYTKEVLKARMAQSDKLLYLSSERARSSEWVTFELEYYRDYVKREILMIMLDGEDPHSFKRIDVGALSCCFEEEQGQ